MKKNYRSLLSFSILMATQGVWAQSTAPNHYSSPFANVPLHLDSKTVVNKKSNVVKPNVMFFVDDSGSMRQGITPIDSQYTMGYYGGSLDGCVGNYLYGSNQSIDPTKLCFFAVAYSPVAYTKYPNRATYNFNDTLYSLINRGLREKNLHSFEYVTNIGSYQEIAEGEYLGVKYSGLKNEIICQHNGQYYLHAHSRSLSSKNCYKPGNPEGIVIPMTVRRKTVASYTYWVNDKALDPNTPSGDHSGYRQPNKREIRIVDAFTVAWHPELGYRALDGRMPSPNHPIGDEVSEHHSRALAMHCINYNINGTNSYRCADAIMYGKAYRYNLFGNGFTRSSYIRFQPEDRSNVRILVVMDALHKLLDAKQDQANWNITTLHNTETRFEKHSKGFLNQVLADLPIQRPFMKAQDMRRYINALTPWGGTPTTEDYLGVAQTMYDNIDLRCRKNYIILLSDGDANGSNFSHIYQNSLRNGGFKQILGRYFNFSGTIFNSRFFKPNSSDDGDGLSAITRVLYDNSMRSNGTDAEGKPWDELDFNGKPYKQNIETFTIGFGDSLSPNGRNYLVNAATGGECKGTAVHGAAKEGKCFFNATDAQSLSDAFDKILSSIESSNQVAPESASTFSIATPSATGATSTESAALLTLDITNWASKMKFAKFGSDNKPLRDSSGKIVLVDAGYYQSGKTMRDIILSAGGKHEFIPTTGAAPSAYTSQSPHFGLGFAEYQFGMAPWLLRPSDKNDAQIEAEVSSRQSQKDRKIQSFRIRAATATDDLRQMSDVIGTPTVAIGRDSNNRQKYIVTAANDGMVYMFRSESDPAKFATHPYNLLLNYLPADMQRQSADLSLTVGKALSAVADANYGLTVDTPHIYLNNGGTTWIKTPKTAKMPQQYSLIGNMGQGARGTYALNIAGEDRRTGGATGLDAPKASYLTTVPLWETEKGANNALGYTISSPTVGQIATQKKSDGKAENQSGVHLYTFVANGYSTGISSIPYDDKPTLYVYDTFGQEFGIGATQSQLNNGNTPGKLITKIPVSDGQAGALSSPTLLDSDLDGLVDFAFAGDQYGNLWRFDLRGNPNKWTSSGRVTKLYAGKPEQPITAAPTLFKMEEANKFVVIFGTGSDIFEKDQRDLAQQMVMGIYHDVTENVETLHHHEQNKILLQDITEGVGRDDDNNAVTIRSLTTHAMGSDHKAWRVDLKVGRGERTQVTNTRPKTTVTSFEGSEKVTAQPRLLLGSLYLSTRIYAFENTEVESGSASSSSKETCNIEQNESKTISQGDSWLMTLDVKNGGNPHKNDGYSYLTGVHADKTPGATGGNEAAVAGVKLNHLASAVNLFNRSALGSDILQTDAHGAISSGEIVSLENAVDVLAELKRTCLEADANYEAMLSIADTTGRDTIRNFSIDGNRCPAGEAFIRVNWREISL